MEESRINIINDLASRREWFGLFSLSLPTILLSIDTSVLYLALPHISTNLHANSSEQLWIMDIYGFMLAAFLIVMGNLGDRIGYRKLLLIGSAAFGAISIMAAFSPNAIALITARAIMGIAGATIMPSALALIRNMFVNEKQRSIAISVWMSCFMVGMIAGPLIGGLMLEYFWWGSVFLLSVPVMIISIFAGRIFLPEYRHNNGKKSDIRGAIYSLTTILPFIYGLTELSRSDFSTVSILAIIVSVVFGAVFYQHEKKAASPLADFTFFKNKIFNITLIAMLLTAVTMGGVALFIAQYLQIVMNLSPLNAGFWMVPQVFGMISGSILIPVISKKTSPGILIATGLFISAIGMMLLTNTPVTNGIGIVVTGFVISVFGASPILILGTGIIIGSAPPEKAGTVGSIAETSNQLGVALGIAILGSIGAWTYRTQIVKHFPGSSTNQLIVSIGESITGATSVANALDASNKVSLLLYAKQSFVTGFHVVAAIGAIVFLGLTFITAKGLRLVK